MYLLNILFCNRVLLQVFPGKILPNGKTFIEHVDNVDAIILVHINRCRI